MNLTFSPWLVCSDYETWLLSYQLILLLVFVKCEFVSFPNICFFPRLKFHILLKIWNNLPLDLKRSSSLSIFKNRLLNSLFENYITMWYKPNCYSCKTKCKYALIFVVYMSEKYFKPYCSPSIIIQGNFHLSKHPNEWFDRFFPS